MKRKGKRNTPVEKDKSGKGTDVKRPGKPASLIARVRAFIGEDVWEKTADDYSSRKGWWLVRQVRLILYTARGVQRHNTVIRSAALTFFTLMSLVPMLALAFGIIKGFGLQEALESYLYERFPDNSQMIGDTLGFVNNVLQRTSGGIVAVSGLAVLVWAAARVFGNVENAFNTIWEVKKSRSISRKASTYAAVIFIMPLLAVLLAVVLSYVRNLIAHYASIPYNILYAIGSFLILWLLFAGAYKAIPNTKVQFRHAAKAATVAAVAFSIFQLVYVYLQNGVSSYNIIYGSFAAVPLFLLWIQSSWQIVLFGAELSFSFQNVNNFVQEHDAININADSRRKVMIAVMLVVTRAFLRNEGAVSTAKAAAELGLPVRLVRDVMYSLDEAGLIVAITQEKSQKTNMYVPARDVHSMRLSDVITAVEDTGTAFRTEAGNRYLETVTDIVNKMRTLIENSDDNLTLTQLTDEEDKHGDHR